jgi:hypothetical protein
MRTSMISSTPLAAQASISESRIAREALAMSMVFAPTPSQNRFRPAEEPPDSTTGVGKVGILAERFGDDRGIGQHGRRAGDLDVVARGGGSGRQRRKGQRGRGGLGERHAFAPQVSETQERGPRSGPP